MSDWQHICTAPRDGSEVLLCWENGRINFGRWEDDADAKWPKPFWLESWKKRRETNGPLYRKNQPTHWMPIPAPPAKWTPPKP